MSVCSAINLKVIIIGDSSVGKSNILLRYVNKKFELSHDITIGVEYGIKLINKNNAQYKLQIWDTAGQEVFRSITKPYYRTAVGCLIVYDVTDINSFNNVSKWLEDVKTMSDPDIVIILVGNKTDLIANRIITYDEAKQYADDNKLIYFETSAYNGDNVDECFMSIIDNISSAKLDSIKCNNLDKSSVLHLSNNSDINNRYCCYII